MAERLSWQEIKELYPDEWVELIDVEWDLTGPDPNGGVVRVHHRDKKEFKKLIMQDRPPSSALVYSGNRLFPEGKIFSANMNQFTKS